VPEMSKEILNWLADAVNVGKNRNFEIFQKVLAKTNPLTL